MALALYITALKISCKEGIEMHCCVFQHIMKNISLDVNEWTD